MKSGKGTIKIPRESELKDKWVGYFARVKKL